MSTALYLSRIIERLGRPRTAAILTVSLVTVLGVVNGLDFPLSVPFVQRATGHDYLDMCAFCSAEAVQHTVAGLGERGRLLQALLLPTIDIVIPLLSCLFGLSVLAALTRGSRRAVFRRWSLVLPVAAMALDFAENITIALLLLRYPKPSTLLTGLEGLLSGLKFTMYGAVVAMILALLLKRVVIRATANQAA